MVVPPRVVDLTMKIHFHFFVSFLLLNETSGGGGDKTQQPLRQLSSCRLFVRAVGP